MTSRRILKSKPDSIMKAKRIVNLKRAFDVLSKIVFNRISKHVFDYYRSCTIIQQWFQLVFFILHEFGPVIELLFAVQ